MILSTIGPVSRWGMRAASLYDADYARRYRERDEQLLDDGGYTALANWLGAVCARFERPIDVLDLGCGTGRHFWALSGVKTLTGLDASAAMLREAARPVRNERIGAPAVSLVEGDLLTHDFPPASFDLVYSIGVLAEHVPFDQAIVSRVTRWLRPGGRFAFTTVHPDSPSVPMTAARRVARGLLPLMPGAAGRALHARLMGHGTYGDERWIRDRLAPAFTIESLDRITTDVHLHGRCVARRGERGQ